MPEDRGAPKAHTSLLSLYGTSYATVIQEMDEKGRLSKVQLAITSSWGFGWKILLPVTSQSSGER